MLIVLVVRLNKENIPSRAYVAFKNEELLAHFSREYDGHIFRDKSGVSPRFGVHSDVLLTGHSHRGGIPNRR
jgi:hypothetical protein